MLYETNIVDKETSRYIYKRVYVNRRRKRGATFKS